MDEKYCFIVTDFEHGYGDSPTTAVFSEYLEELIKVAGRTNITIMIPKVSIDSPVEEVEYVPLDNSGTINLDSRLEKISSVELIKKAILMNDTLTYDNPKVSGMLILTDTDGEDHKQTYEGWFPEYLPVLQISFKQYCNGTPYIIPLSTDKKVVFDHLQALLEDAFLKKMNGLIESPTAYAPWIIPTNSRVLKKQNRRTAGRPIAPRFTAVRKKKDD